MRLARRGALLLEQGGEARRRSALVGLQVVDLLAEPLQEDVEVADGPERAAEPGQLGSEGVGPRRVEERRGGAQNRPQAPRGHARLVELLGVLAEPRAGVVGDQLAGLQRDHRPHVLERRRPARRGRRLDREEPERPERLRPSVGRRRAGGEEHALQAGKRVGAALQRLHLQLDEALAHAAPVQHGHGVHGDVRHEAPVLPRADALAPRAEDGRRLEGAAAQDAHEEPRELVRRRPRPAGRLELEPLTLAGELELPEPAPVLHAPAQRDARPREGAVGRVVVRRGERVGPERLAGKLGQRESRGDRELQLALARLAERCHGRIVAPQRVWIAVFPALHRFATILPTMPNRILIVDDHPSFRATAKIMLLADGFEVVGEAEDGRTALEAVERLRPDLVLLDVQLPDMDGFTVVNELRRRDSHRPKIVLTSSHDESDFGPIVARCGAAAFVPKGELSGAALRAVLR